MKFRILGPVEVVADGRTLRCTGRPLSLLVLLLLERGGVSPPTRPSRRSGVNGCPPIPRARSTSSRRASGASSARTGCSGSSGGYRLASSASDALDADEFAALARRGRETLAGGDAGAAREVLDAALALWRGRALEDVRHEPFALAAADGLDDARLDALEARIDADLALGRHHHLLTELAALVARHPLRERLRGQLMLALYRCGRQAEALTAYRDLREALGEELGLEPSEELRALQRAILLHEAGLPAARATRREVVCVITEVPRRSARRPLDLEVLHGVLAQSRAAAEDVARAHGDPLVDLRGGEITAVFGSPTAHEDDAVRAERSARALLRRLDVLGAALASEQGIQLVARAAVAAGPVLTRPALRPARCRSARSSPPPRGWRVPPRLGPSSSTTGRVPCSSRAGARPTGR